MKPAREWTEKYLLSLPVQEYDDIEFKAPQWIEVPKDQHEKLFADFAKEICSLANSGGGKLVIGIKDPKDTKGDTLEIINGGVLKTIEKKDTAEWLRAKIPRLLDSELIGFDVHPITRKGRYSKIALDKAIYVVDVPDSNLAPHQSASDNKYYIRIGGNSVPAPHRIVLDILGRRQHPNLDISFSISGELSDGVSPQPGIKRYQRFSLLVTATNIGRVYAQFVNISLDLPPDIMPNVDTWVAKQVEDNETIICRESLKNTRRDSLGPDPTNPYAPKGPSWFDPILPKCSHVWALPLSNDFERISLKDVAILWEVYADNAGSKSGEISVESIPVKREWDETGCECCGGSRIQGGYCTLECDRRIIPGYPFLCPQCLKCTGRHCECRERRR